MVNGTLSGDATLPYLIFTFLLSGGLFWRKEFGPFTLFFQSSPDSEQSLLS